MLIQAARADEPIYMLQNGVDPALREQIAAKNDPKLLEKFDSSWAVG